jgi:hypothetical protein
MVGGERVEELGSGANPHGAAGGGEKSNRGHAAGRHAGSFQEFQRRNDADGGSVTPVAGLAATKELQLLPRKTARITQLLHVSPSPIATVGWLQRR